MQFDREKFFIEYRRAFLQQADGSAKPLKQEQVEGMEMLLNNIEGDQDITDSRWVAYMLATVKHETAGTFQPIREIGRGKGRSYGIPDPITKQVYYGRGYVQLTWKRNYQKYAEITGEDLLNDPDLAMMPSVAYQIMSHGMRTGGFTGKRFSDYLSLGADYVNARRIINGLDKAQLIAAYARKFETVLAASAAAEKST